MHHFEKHYGYVMVELGICCFTASALDV